MSPVCRNGSADAPKGRFSLRAVRERRGQRKRTQRVPAGIALLCRPVADGFAWVDHDARPAIVEQGTRDELRMVIGNRPWAALYPAEKTLLTTAAVATRRQRDAHRAARYALEEALAGDVEKAHVVIARDRTSGRYPAVVTDAAELSEYLQAFGDPADRPTYVVPEVLALPWCDGEWTLARDGDRVVLRLGPWSGLALLATALPEYLAVLHGEGRDPPRAVAVLPADTASEHALGCAGLAQRTAGPEPYLAQCARTLAAGLSLDLRAGAFARPVRGPRTWSLAVLSLSVVLAAVALPGVSLLELRAVQQKRVDLAREVETLVAGINPAVHDLAQARSAITRVVDTLRSEVAVHQGSFLVMSGYLGQVVAAEPGISLRQLRYEPGILEAQVEAADLSSIDGLRRSLDELPGVAAHLTGVMAHPRQRAVGRIAITVAAQ